MSYFSNITNAVSTLIDGMKVTMGYFVRPRENVTLQYPDEVWPVPERNIGVGELETYNTVRSKLHVNMDDCIGCKACERACPVDCIHIDAYKGGPDQDLGTTSNGTKIKLLVANFTIDMSECMFCDLCTHPCPEDCIEMTPDYQFISNDNLNTDVTPEERWRDRDHLIYQFSMVPEEERQRLKAEAEEAAKAKALAMAAKKAAAEKAAAEKAAAEKAAAADQTTPESPVVEESPQSAAPPTEESSTETSPVIPIEEVQTPDPAPGKDSPATEPAHARNDRESELKMTGIEEEAPQNPEETPSSETSERSEESEEKEGDNG